MFILAQTIAVVRKVFLYQWQDDGLSRFHPASPDQMCSGYMPRDYFFQPASIKSTICDQFCDNGVKSYRNFRAIPRDFGLWEERIRVCRGSTAAAIQNLLSLLQRLKDMTQSPTHVSIPSCKPNLVQENWWKMSWIFSPFMPTHL